MSQVYLSLLGLNQYQSALSFLKAQEETFFQEKFFQDFLYGPSVCDLWGTRGRRGCDQTSREGAGSMGVRSHGWLRGGDVGWSARR